MLIFRDPRKRIDFDLKIKIDGKKITPCTSVKYLGIFIDCHLNWHKYKVELSTKLSRAVGMLSKIRYYVNKETLHMIYYGIFSSILTYGSQIWGQQDVITKKLQILQNKALRIMHFQPPRTTATPLFKSSNILKLNDHINLQNFLLTHDSLKNNLPKSMKGKMDFLAHPHETRNLDYLQLYRPRTNTIIYGSKSINARSIDIWNSINLNHHHEKLHVKSRAICKKFVYKLLLSKY